MTTGARGGGLWLGVAGLLSLRGGHWRRAARRGLMAAATGMAGGHLLGLLLPRRRPRAHAVPARQALPEHPTSSSFPSNHAMVAAAFTTATVLTAPSAGLLTVPLATVVCYGRVRTRVHWPGDVAGGAALGIAIAVGQHRLLAHAGRLHRGPFGPGAAGAGGDSDQ
ncbi:phosphatase PAP2 family protein [Amycolatopsis sp. NPDC051061]|uniref:phosphatase PAP2 family protein n=1 Tax=Amycolatopsis sp. NPDC051061 TaxID=3155042 RepID=UPI003449F88F